MKICGQQKRTSAFVKDLYSRLGNAGVYITTFDGNALSRENFKDMDKTTEIVICKGDISNQITSTALKV